MKRNLTFPALVLGLALILPLTNPTTAGAGHPTDQAIILQTSANDPAPEAIVGSAFTYQGRLTDNGNPANGNYDFRFNLYDADSGGTLIAGPINIFSQAVSNGLFTVSLNISTIAFEGEARYLQIEVKPAGGGSFTILSPRQPITPAPYALSLRPGAKIEGSVSSGIALLNVYNTNTNGVALYGIAHGTTAKGVQGISSNGYGGYFNSSSGIAVSASGADGIDTTGTATDGNGIRATANNGTGARGVLGISSSGTGVYGTSTSGTGIYGTSSSSYGVNGTSTSGYAGNFTSVSNRGVNATGSIGVYGTGLSFNSSGVSGVANNGPDANGIYGTSSSGNGAKGYSTASNGAGVYGEAHASGASGVEGFSNAGKAINGTSSSGSGGYFTSTTGNGITVIGGTGINSTGGNGIYSTGTASNGVGLWGVANNGFTAKAVYGTSTSGFGVQGTSSASSRAGVFGVASASSGSGVYGYASGEPAAYGVFGESSTGWAGYFLGDVAVTGSCCAMAEGHTRIDHPLDPENKYLYQALVQSPEMITTLSGNVTTGANGEAVVQLPSYFQATNTDFRYQLTPIGQFAQAIVLHEVENNSFAIKTDRPNIKISWQITGVRNDPYALAHPFEAEPAKPDYEKGTYLYPTEYGQPESKATIYGMEPESK